MNSSSEYLFINDSTIRYLKFGCGTEPLVCFHGFSEDARSFESLDPSLADKYTLFSIDFPYHGETKWKGEKEFRKRDMMKLLRLLFEKEGIDRFSIFGFSMGGKVGLSLLKEMAPKINTLFLAAPDGIKTHKIFDLAVYPSWGRWVFKMVMQRPGLFFFFVKLLYRSGTVSRFLYEFTFFHMETKIRRDRIFHTWMSIKDFKTDIDAAKNIINTHKIQVHLFFGERDGVIKPRVGEEFMKGLNNATLTVLPKGHQLITSSLNPYLKKILHKS